MISKGGLKFNCCESVLLIIDETNPLPGFNHKIMRIASNFGGGVGGWGSICGAVSGSSMALGLLYGTEGTESPDEFESKRERMRAIAQEFMKEFEAEFSSVNCMDLLKVDRRTEEGKRLYEEMKERGETHCEEYVEWSANRILKMIDFSTGLAN